MKLFKYLFLLVIALTIIIVSCNKDNLDADIAINVVGVYTGTWTASGSDAPGTVELIKVSGNSVNIASYILGTTIPTIPGVSVSDEGNGKIKLSYSDPSGTAVGTIQNNSLSLTITSGATSVYFSGTK